MTRVSPGVRIVTVVSDENTDEFVAAAHDFEVDLSREQARALLVEAHYYAHEAPVYRTAPRPRDLDGQIQSLEECVEQLAGVLADPITSSLLRQRSGCPDLQQLATNLHKLSETASVVRKRLPEDTGGDDDPFLRPFILIARRIYEEAGGPGKGSYWSDVHGGYRGKFYALVESALKQAMGNRFNKTNSALGQAIRRTLEQKDRPPEN